MVTNRRCTSAAWACPPSIRNGCQLGSFLIETVGERKILPASALEDGTLRAPGGQGTEEDYSISTLLANKNYTPRTTGHADPPPLFFIAWVNFAYPGL